MKKIIQTIMLFALVGFVASCDDMNSIHQEFLDRGERVYIGIPIILEANAGYERIEVVWEQNADPRIHETIIFWNNRQDSVVIPIDRTGGSIMETIIPLPEGTYILEVLNVSRTGHRSLANTMAVESFGQNFKNRLSNRTITNAVATPDRAVLTWSLEDGVVGTTISYVNRYGVPVTVLIDGNQTTLEVNDFVAGGEFTHSSLFRPAGSIDEIPSNPATGRFPSFFSFTLAEWEADPISANFVQLDRSGWVVIRDADTQPAPAWAVENLFDNNLTTGWHSRWSAPLPPLPHIIDVDMQVPTTISTIEVFHRADVRRMYVYISSDGNEWNVIGSVGFSNIPAQPAPNITAVLMSPTPVVGKYLRLVVTESLRVTEASLWEVRATTPAP